MAHEPSSSSSQLHHHHHQALGCTNFSSSPAEPGMQSFQPSHDQLYGLQTASDSWRAFFPPQPLGNENLVCPWQPPNRMLVDESSPARFLFPSAAASGGLSLSLNHAAAAAAAAAAEASNSGAASYQPPQPPLFHQLAIHEHKPPDYLQYHNDGRGTFLQSSVAHPANNSYYYNHQLKNSKFLLPARELLNEFCSVEAAADSSKQKGSRNKQWEEGGGLSSSAVFNQSLISSLDIHELQGRKVKLLAMLEEVDRRYRRYREQMRAVVTSFEAAAGEGAAAAYVALASRVMSKHFRCLRDGIVGQIHAIRKAAGGDDMDEAVAPGTTRGETPRLKVIDQCLRQHRAFQQAGSLESHPWRPQRGLPERSVSILRAWLFEHFLHPYPSDVDKHILARQTGLSRSQVSNWFINARVRLWKPMVEEMYLEETKEHDTSQEENDDDDSSNVIFNSPEFNMEDQKPPALHDPDSLSWVIMSNPHGRVQQPIHGASGAGGGAIDMDFASYNQQQWAGGGVSLTLGLQQHDGGGGGGVSLSFSPPAAQQQPAESMLFGGARGEQMENQFPMLDGEGQINVPYRNLMGAQLLRDLAG